MLSTTFGNEPVWNSIVEVTTWVKCAQFGSIAIAARNDAQSSLISGARIVGRDGRTIFETHRVVTGGVGFRCVLIARSSSTFHASSIASFFLMAAISLLIACNSVWDFLLTKYFEPSCATMYRSAGF